MIASTVVQLLSHVQHFATPGTDCSTPGFSVLHCRLESAHTHVYCGDDATQLFILCCPLLVLSSIFLSIRVFSNESALHIMWPKY